MATAEELMVDTVAERLRTEATRTHTLSALEAMMPAVPRELALAAAPALVDVASGTQQREDFNRCVLLLARLVAEAAPNPSPVWGAACSGEREKAFCAPRLVAKAAQRALATAGTGEGHPLTREEAYSEACWRACEPPASVRGITAPKVAAGHTMMEFIKIVSANHPCLLLFVALPHRAWSGRSG